MLKYAICVVVLILAITFFGFIFTRARNPPIIWYELCGETIFNVRDGDMIDFQLHSKREVDTSGMRGRFRIVEGTPFTWFVQIGSLPAWNGLLNSFTDVRIEYDEFDFNFEDYPAYNLVVTFGRELLEMRNIGFNPQGYNIKVAITFAEEYQGDIMFLYLMDNIPISLASASEYYILRDSETVFIGNSKRVLNEHIPPSRHRGDTIETE